MKKTQKICVGLVAGFINGTLGTGGGTILVALLEHFGVKPKISHATSISVILPISVFSAIIYIFHKNINFYYALITGGFGIIGGIIGAKLLNKFSDKIIKTIFAITTIIIGIMILRR